MDKFCINHPEEKAVGTCGGCSALTCYRCSMNIDQLIYCSLECFNQVNPPSTMQLPRVSSPPKPPIHDEFSDMMEAIGSRPPVPPPAPSTSSSPPASLEDPSVVLSAFQADPAASARRNTTRIKHPSPPNVPGGRPPLPSSSCYYHPDTSAIVRCAECRNPICSLCSRETPGGP